MRDAVPIRPLLHQFVQSQVFPRRLSFRLSGTLDAECGMLVWYHVVLVFWVDGLVVRGDVDLFEWERSASKVLLKAQQRPGNTFVSAIGTREWDEGCGGGTDAYLEEVRNARLVKVDIGTGRVFRLSCTSDIDVSILIV